MDIAIIGLGLTGGSLARTAKLRTDCRIFGFDRDRETVRLAIALGAIDAELNDEKLRGCQIVLICLYPGEIVSWLKENAGRIAPDTLVIDCGGVKRAVMDGASEIARGQRWHFIGGHPMAGREYSGFRYARDDLFDNSSMILTPMPKEELPVLQRARDFFMDLGFRRVQFTTPPIHDELIAYTSQLLHVISGAYVMDPLALRHKGFSSDAFGGMVHMVGLNEDIWTELMMLNRDCLLPEVDGLIERLSAFREALSDGDGERLHSLLKQAHERRESMEDA
ncbi:MAG: prephenate dehydrogenase [Clostridia bacterium]|nr:prephenate dehydrogenase [Clostridia bacterium]